MKSIFPRLSVGLVVACCGLAIGAGLFLSRANDDATKQRPKVARIVLFGFAPFGGRAENASWQVARQFADGDAIRSYEVPVVWAEPGKKLAEVVTGEGPWLLVGLGEGTSRFSVELVGRNERRPYSDEAGRKPQEKLIADGAPEQIPVDGMAREIAVELKARGFPTGTSTDAGGYLCNEMLYELLRLRESNPAVAGAFFIHVPIFNREIDGPEGRVTMNQEYCDRFGRELIEILRGHFDLVGAEASP
jgi:pyroglutamyl-peptidase